ncbi:MAG: GreA/GreB family elongation factor, partial [Sphingopyxis sp.]|nr:GreA/GreB family elongation factor [Sphingopyxis sp.]
LYGRKRMREIDRRLGWLAKRMKAAKVVDPAVQPDKSRVFFGATVDIADEDDRRRTLTIVGNDEADAGAGRIGWDSPLARALRGAATGDLRRAQLPGGEVEYEVMAIRYV